MGKTLEYGSSLQEIKVHNAQYILSTMKTIVYNDIWKKKTRKMMHFRIYFTGDGLDNQINSYIMKMSEILSGMIIQFRYTEYVDDLSN